MKVYGVYNSYSKNIFLKLKENLEKDGIKLEDFNKYIPSDDIKVFFLISGGTSDLIKDFIDKKTIVISWNKYNSLASALSLKEKVRSRFIHIHNRNLLDLKRTLRNLEKVNFIIYNLLNTTVLVFKEYLNKKTKKEINDTLGFLNKISKVFGVKNNLIFKFTSLSKDIEIIEIEDEEIEKIKKEYKTKIFIDNVLKFYLKLRKYILKNDIEVIIIDCFNFIKEYKFTPCLPFSLLNSEGIVSVCENSIYSIIPMLISKYYYGRVGFMGNIVDFYKNKLILAHCTINKSLTRKIELLPHFETKLPIGIKGYLKEDIKEGYLMKFNGKTIDIIKVRVLGDYNSENCLTQIEFEILDDRNLESLIGNHYIFIPKSDESLEILIKILKNNGII